MDSTPGSSSKPIRSSQREVKSCGFCYRRKVKCDKVFPCSRCVSRGLGDLCEQESVIVNGRITGSGAERTVRRQPTLPQLIEENKSLHRKLNAQEKVIRTLMEQLQAIQISGGIEDKNAYGSRDGHDDRDELDDGYRDKLEPKLENFEDDADERDKHDEGSGGGGETGAMALKKRKFGSADTDRAVALATGFTGTALSRGESGSRSGKGGRPESGVASGIQSAASTPEPEVRAAELERAEYLATVGQVFGLSQKEAVSGQQPNHLFTQPGEHTLESLRSLVPLKHSPFLVRWHCNFLHWIHPVFHVPTFIREHDEWICALLEGESPERSYDFYALYYAIIACSLYFMDNNVAIGIGMTQEALDFLPRFWFDTALNCLQLSGFMVFPTMPVLQAICILPMIAHAFDSKYLSSLMHCALGLARDLNFHLVSANTPPGLFGGVVRCELIRRVWWCLKLSDSLSPGAQHPFHLTYPAAWTSPPANVNDDELSDDRPVKPHELSHTTCVSHLILMARLSDLFRDFCHTFSTKESLGSRYRCVKSFDERLDHLFDVIPELKPYENEVYVKNIDQSENAPFDWRPWSRFLWAAAVSTCRIQLYRWFLGRSYSDERFAEVRSICVQAARTTLAVREIPVPPMFQKNWHVSSYTVISGMVLAIELTHGRPDPDAASRLRAEVVEVLTLLRATSNPNAMVRRGIEILDKMLVEAEASAKTGNDNTSSTAARGKNKAKGRAPGGSIGPLSTSMSCMPIPGGQVGVPGQMAPAPVGPAGTNAGFGYGGSGSAPSVGMATEGVEAGAGTGLGMATGVSMGMGMSMGTGVGSTAVGAGVFGGENTGAIGVVGMSGGTDGMNTGLGGLNSNAQQSSDLGFVDFTQGGVWPTTIPLDLDSDLLNILLNGDSWSVPFPESDALFDV